MKRSERAGDRNVNAGAYFLNELSSLRMIFGHRTLRRMTSFGGWVACKKAIKRSLCKRALRRFEVNERFYFSIPSPMLVKFLTEI